VRPDDGDTPPRTCPERHDVVCYPRQRLRVGRVRVDAESTDGTPDDGDDGDPIDLDAERQARRPSDAFERKVREMWEDDNDPSLQALARLVRALDTGGPAPSGPDDGPDDDDAV